MEHGRLGRLTRMALLTAAALILFAVEAQLPNPVPIAGAKLGLANTVTVYALFAMGPGPALGILLSRVLLGVLVTGRVSALFYSLGGGLLCYAALLLFHKLVTIRQIWVCGVVGAVFHNVGQIAVAVALTQTPGVVAYLPFLLLVGMVTGSMTGLCAQLLVLRLPPSG